MDSFILQMLEPWNSPAVPFLIIAELSCHKTNSLHILHHTPNYAKEAGIFLIIYMFAFIFPALVEFGVGIYFFLRYMTLYK